MRDPQGGMRGLETCPRGRFLEDGMGAGMQVPCLGPEVCPVHSADSQDPSHPVLPDAFDSLPVLSFLFTAQVGEDTGPDITGGPRLPGRLSPHPSLPLGCPFLSCSRLPSAVFQGHSGPPGHANGRLRMSPDRSEKPPGPGFELAGVGQELVQPINE